MQVIPTRHRKENAMPVDASTLETYEGKQVILHLIAEDGSVNELTGKVENASEVGMAFKEKGKRDVELVLPDQIEEISVAPSEPKKITQKKVLPVTESNVRRHLADRHGFLLSDLAKMSDADAFAQHEAIDHSDLGHRHEAKDEGNSSDED